MSSLYIKKREKFCFEIYRNEYEKYGKEMDKKEFFEHLTKYCLSKNEKAPKTKGKGGAEHYWNISRMLYKFYKCNLENFDVLSNSGLIFSGVAHKTIKYFDSNRDACIDMINGLLKTYRNLNINRELLESYLSKYFPDGLTKFAKHEELRRKVTDFLKEEECFTIFPKRMADFETKEETQIDVVGWSKKNNDIYGIDAKVEKEDFKKFINKKINLYTEYCNNLYIITNNVDVLKMADNDCKKNGKRYGLIFWNEKNYLDVIWKPDKGCITKKMQNYIKDVYKKYVANMIIENDFNGVSTYNDVKKVIGEIIEQI